MNTDWRKLMRILAVLSGAYIATLSVVADLVQVLTFKYGLPLLALLLLAVVGYVSWEQGQRFWRNYRALQARLGTARHFLRRYGDNVLRCALTRWLFEQHVGSIRVISTDEPEAEIDTTIIVLNVSEVPLRSDDHLEGMYFAITGPDRGERAKGQVILCDSEKAHLKLSDHPVEAPREGDLAVPIDPPETTELEKLLGDILFILSE